MKFGADVLNILKILIPQSLTWPDFLGSQPAKLNPNQKSRHSKAFHQ